MNKIKHLTINDVTQSNPLISADLATQINNSDLRETPREQTNNSNDNNSNKPYAESTCLINKRTSFNKMFGRMDGSSLRSGALVLFQSAVGAGALSLPYKAKEVGVFNLILIMLLTAVIIQFVNSVLGRISILTGAQTYPQLIKIVTGSNVLIQLYQLSIIGYAWGTIAFQEKLTSELIHAILGIQLDMDTEFAAQQLSLDSLLFITTTIAFSLCMTKDLSKFAILGQIAVVALCQIVLVLFSQIFFRFEYDNWSKINFQKADLIPVCTTFTTCLYGMNSVINIFTGVKMIKNPTQKRIEKMAYISNISVFSVYFFLFIGGYFSYLELTPKSILSAIHIDQNNQPFLVGILLYCMVLLISTVVNIQPIRICVQDFIELTMGHDLSDNTQLNLILTIIIVQGGYVICVYVEEMLLVVNVCAGFFALQQAILLPILIQNLQQSRIGEYMQIRILSIFLSIICSFMCLISGQISFNDIINQIQIFK